MFIGEYIHTLDPKKRLALPARFRKELGGKVVITRGLDQCLFVYALAAWEEIAQKLNTLPVGQAANRSFVRLMLAGASEADIDQLGRVLLPDYLKRYAAIGQKVIIVGVGSRLEIWAQEKWEAYRSEIEQHTDELAERLGEIGAF
ncbi:MAG: division/cell wall cluster transcriptional repressor MraZ [Patescibacteria group bacterium]